MDRELNCNDSEKRRLTCQATCVLKLTAKRQIFALVASSCNTTGIANKRRVREDAKATKNENCEGLKQSVITAMAYLQPHLCCGTVGT